MTRARAWLATLCLACGLGAASAQTTQLDFEGVDASRPIDVVRGDDGALVFRGAFARVRLPSGFVAMRGTTALTARDGVVDLRTSDRIVASPSAESGELVTVPARGALEERVAFVVHSRLARRIDGSDAGLVGACPSAPSEDATRSFVDPSRIRFELGGRDPSDACLVEIRVRSTTGVRNAVRLPCGTDSSRAIAHVRVVAEATESDGESRSVVAELGDVVEAALVGTNGNVVARVLVGAPGSACEPRTVRLALRVVRADVATLSPAGATRASVASNLEAVLAHTRATYAACGIVPVATIDTVLRDAPPPFVLSVAEGDGLPARGGGQIRFTVNGRPLGPFPTTPGARPSATAASLVSALRAEGWEATVVELPRIDRAADGAADVLVRDARGEPVRLGSMEGVPLSTDARQTISIGRVDFADGLDEFDLDASRTGTLEERTLLYALRDDDPTTIDVLVMERFHDESRLGEAFVRRDGGPLAGSVLVARRGMFHEPSTYTLAHELGHVLLDDPFHPSPAAGAPFPRVMGADSGRRDVSVVRAFSREECDRMRFAGAPYFVPGSAF